MGRCFLLIIFLVNCCYIAWSQQDIQQFQSQIDSLLNDAIDSSAFPGAQVLIRHKDKVLVHKAFGFQTYDKKVPVDNDDLYDLASVTKIMAGGLALMKMQDMGLFDPSETLAETHPYLRNSNKKDIAWKEVLAHQSGLQPYIVFWQTAKNKRGKFKWRTFSQKGNNRYRISIDDNLYLHRRYAKKILKLIKKSPLKEDKDYLYSGLGFLLIPDLVYRRTGLCLDEFLSKEVFEPLDADRISFRPLERFDIRDIIPTEKDTFFRMKTVHGYVHDENASMLNGVSANAGLFSNSASLDKIAQFLLDPENKIIRNDIIQQYTSVQFPENRNRRGLTFDKPLLDFDDGSSYIARSANPESFGHSGFTGTFIWVDPASELTVIFLSNRVYPYRSNRKLYSMDFRPKLHQAAYDYLLNQKE